MGSESKLVLAEATGNLRRTSSRKAQDCYRQRRLPLSRASPIAFSKIVSLGTYTLQPRRPGLWPFSPFLKSSCRRRSGVRKAHCPLCQPAPEPAETRIKSENLLSKASIWSARDRGHSPPINCHYRALSSVANGQESGVPRSELRARADFARNETNGEDHHEPEDIRFARNHRARRRIRRRSGGRAADHWHRRIAYGDGQGRCRRRQPAGIRGTVRAARGGSEHRRPAPRSGAVHMAR